MAATLGYCERTSNQGGLYNVDVEGKGLDDSLPAVDLLGRTKSWTSRSWLCLAADSTAQHCCQFRSALPLVSWKKMRRSIKFAGMLLSSGFHWLGRISFCMTRPSASAGDETRKSPTHSTLCLILAKLGVRMLKCAKTTRNTKRTERKNSLNNIFGVNMSVECCEILLGNRKTTRV